MIAGLRSFQFVGIATNIPVVPITSIFIAIARFAASIAEAYPFHQAIRDLYARKRAVKRHLVDNAALKATLNPNLPNNSCRRTHDNYVWFIERFIYN